MIYSPFIHSLIHSSQKTFTGHIFKYQVLRLEIKIVSHQLFYKIHFESDKYRGAWVA